MSRSNTASPSGQTPQVGNDTEVESNQTDLEKQIDPKTGEPIGGSLYQPKTVKFWLLIACNLLSLFIVALDRTIITTAIPRITDDFHSLGDIGWYGSGYMLMSSIAQLVYGRIYKFYDMKWVFLTTVIIFEIGSAICGAAPTSGAFIAGRAIAGLAGAGIFSGCQLVIIPLVPLHKRPMFQGLFGMIFGVSSVIAPLVGGAFTKSVSWRWCFYINLPIGAVSWVFMFLNWHPPKETREPVSIWTHFKRLDPLGMTFFAPAIVCLLLALQWGGSTYSWSSGRIIALFVIFGVLILAYAAVQILMPESATIPPQVITNRSMFFGSLYTFFVSSGMIMMIYYIPIWFQTVELVSPIQSGVNMIPLMISMVVGTFAGGGTTQVLGYYVPAMYLCPCIMAAGLGLMSTFNLNTPQSHWVGYQFLSGFGLGFGLQIAGLVVQRVLPATDIPIGIGILFFLQQLGGCIFTTVGQTVLSNLLVSQLSGVPGLDASKIINGGATDLISIVPAQYVVVVQQAYNFACTRIFLAAMGVSFAALLSALPMEWKSIKEGENGQDVAESPGSPDGPDGSKAASPGNQEPEDSAMAERPKNEGTNGHA